MKRTSQKTQPEPLPVSYWKFKPKTKSAQSKYTLLYTFFIPIIRAIPSSYYFNFDTNLWNSNHIKKLKLPGPGTGSSASASGFSFAKPPPPSQPKNDIQEQYHRNSPDDFLQAEENLKTETDPPNNNPIVKDDVTSETEMKETIIPENGDQTDTETKAAKDSITDSDDDQVLWSACNAETQKEPILDCLQTSDSEDSENEEKKPKNPHGRQLRRQSTILPGFIPNQPDALFGTVDPNVDISAKAMTTRLLYPYGISHRPKRSPHNHTAI